VERERLLSKLDGVLSKPLLLLSASAGSGKTTLLSTWVVRCAGSSQKIAWLTLDELDNDPTRFWVSVITALRTCLPEIGETALTMLPSPQPPLLSTMLTVLLNEVTALTGEIVLILDDYHLITD
jgi:LuxR family maltose regulon positive regulatory protein